MQLYDLAVRLEETEALDRLAEPLHQKVHQVLGGPGGAKDVLSGSWFGHPLHPALIVLPLGSWLSTTVLDLLGGRGARPAARRLVGAGIVTALPTAASGMSDWSDTSGGERRVGVAHALGNSAALALMVGSWLARRRGRHGLGVGLTLAGNVVGGASAYLGGHLSYGSGVGVDTTVFQQGPQEWTDVAALDDLPEGAAHGVEVDGMRVLLVRDGARVHALAARCTHRGGPLDEGPVADGAVTCPWHGSVFDVATGEVRRGPASIPQPVLEARVVGGRVELRHEPLRALRANTT